MFYAEYVRSISASYAEALSGQRSRAEDAGLLAATAEIEILSGREVWVPARELTDTGDWRALQDRGRRRQRRSGI